MDATSPGGKYHFPGGYFSSFSCIFVFIFATFLQAVWVEGCRALRVADKGLPSAPRRDGIDRWTLSCTLRGYLPADTHTNTQLVLYTCTINTYIYMPRDIQCNEYSKGSILLFLKIFIGIYFKSNFQHPSTSTPVLSRWSTSLWFSSHGYISYTVLIRLMPL